MPWDVLIRDGEVVTPDGVVRADIAIENETIVEIKPALRGSAKTEIAASGLYIFPGVIDPHVHFNEPGRTDWEGFASGSSALAAGGGTSFFDMPLNSSPPTLDAKSFDLKLTAGLANSRADFGLWGGLTPRNLDHLEELAELGVVGFKAFMSNSGIDDFLAADDFTLYRGMQIAAKFGVIVAVHAENDSITSGLAAEAIAAGKTSPGDYLNSRPAIAEIEAITRVIQFAHDTNCQLHIVHVSTAEGARIALANSNHGQITYETCPHYFLLSDADLKTLGARAKCAPPLRSASHAQNFRDLFARGEITFVASDHSPAPDSMKQDDDFFQIWGGISGVQSTLPAMLSIDPPLPPQSVAALTSTNIAKRFAVRGKGKIVVGNDADFALVDLKDEYELKRDMLLDRHKLSPYVGMRFRGRVKRTILRGETIFLDGKMIGNSRGRFIRPQRIGLA